MVTRTTQTHRHHASDRTVLGLDLGENKGGNGPRQSEQGGNEQQNVDSEIDLDASNALVEKRVKVELVVKVVVVVAVVVVGVQTDRIVDQQRKLRDVQYGHDGGQSVRDPSDEAGKECAEGPGFGVGGRRRDGPRGAQDAGAEPDEGEKEKDAGEEAKQAGGGSDRVGDDDGEVAAGGDEEEDDSVDNIEKGVAGGVLLVGLSGNLS